MKKLICLVLAMIFTISFSACGKKKEPVLPAVEIDYETIYSDFFSNRVAGEQNHTGKNYRISGAVVDAIWENYISLTIHFDNLYTKPGDIAGYTYNYVNIYYDETQLDTVAKLSVGDTISFEGVCENEDNFNNCKIIIE